MRVVLQVEDDEDDAKLVQDAFDEFTQSLNEPSPRFQLRRVNSAEHALDLLRGCLEQPSRDLPACLLLDMHMPRQNGRWLLDQLSAHPMLRDLSVFVLSDHPQHVELARSYSNVVGSMRKPAAIDEHRELLRVVMALSLSAGTLPRELR